MANPTHLRILEQGTEKWKQWQLDNPNVEPDLSHTHLREYDLSRYFFKNTNFTGSYLGISGPCNRYQFDNCNFTKAIFDDSEFRQKIPFLEGCTLIGASFKRCTFDDVGFAGSDLTEVSFTGSSFHRVGLGGTNCTNADFTGVSIVKGKYITHLPSELVGANFTGVDLSDQNLSGANLTDAIFTNANLVQTKFQGSCLIQANFSGTSLIRADFSGANLTRANFGGTHYTIGPAETASYVQELGMPYAQGIPKKFVPGASLIDANFENATLAGADFTGSNLIRANFTGANLTGSILEYATLSDTNLEGTILDNCSVYGISAWNVKGTPQHQTELLITPRRIIKPLLLNIATQQPIIEAAPEIETEITVDELQLAQFLHMLLNNANFRAILDTITAKVVLILGRFTPERKAILDKLREELRKKNYLPVLFDFEGPESRNITETVSTLAHLSRFVIADITDPKSIPQELMRIVPDLASVPIQPLILASQKEYGMFEHFENYPWVMKLYRYENEEEVLKNIDSKIIIPAETWIKADQEKRAKKRENSN